MKNKPILVIHNGNKLIKSALAKKFNLRPMDTIVSLPDLKSKISFFENNQNCITDITCADFIDNCELFKLKDYCQIVKVFTDYQLDLDNLEDVYVKEDYTVSQWNAALAYKLWAADLVIYWDSFSVPKSAEIGSPIIFTTGRCGTNLLSDISGIARYFHHDNDILNSDRFDTLKNTDAIYSVFRNNFYSLVASNSISEKLGFVMVTTQENLLSNTELANKLEPYDISDSTVSQTLEEFLNFTDLLLLMRLAFDKKVHLTELELLKDPAHKGKTIKNPYDLNQLVQNQDRIRQLLEEKYDKIYDQACSQMVKYCGLTIV